MAVRPGGESHFRLAGRSINHASAILSEVRGRAVLRSVISMYWQANACGQIAGAPILGAVGSLLSLRAALLPVVWIYRRHRRDAHPTVT